MLNLDFVISFILSINNLRLVIIFSLKIILSKFLSVSLISIVLGIVISLLYIIKLLSYAYNIIDWDLSLFKCSIFILYPIICVTLEEVKLSGIKTLKLIPFFFFFYLILSFM